MTHVIYFRNIQFEECLQSYRIPHIISFFKYDTNFWCKDTFFLDYCPFNLLFFSYR